MSEASTVTTPARLEFGIQNRQIWTWQEQMERWQWFEELGFESLWLTDHMVPTSGPQSSYFEAWTLLSALAMVTSKARIGILVSSNTFRNPAILAKQAVTVDHISGGRLEFGLGAGWYQPEHEMFGIDFPPTGELVDRYSEALDLVDRFLRNDVTTFEGEYYTLKNAPNRPLPVQQPRPPIMIGAHGPRMIRLAARYADSWNSRGTVDEIRERNQVMDAACAKIGRDPREVKRSLLFIPSQMPGEAPWDSPEAFIDFVGRFSEAGVQEFLMQPPLPEHYDMLERIAREVIPALRAG